MFIFTTMMRTLSQNEENRVLVYTYVVEIKFFLIVIIIFEI